MEIKRARVPGEEYRASLRVRSIERAKYPLAAAMALVISFSLCLAGSVIPSARADDAKWSPRGPVEFFFAEGTTREGFQEYLCLGNPGAGSAIVTVEAVFADGQPLTSRVEIPGYSRATLDVEGIAGPNRDISLRVSSDSPFTAERSIYFNSQGVRGSSCVEGIAAASERWYFAEGFTGVGFKEYLCLLNPGTVDARLEMTFLSADGVLNRCELTVPARSRGTVDVSGVVGAGKEVSAVVRSINGVPIVAERPMYFATNEYSGGHCSAGTPVPGRESYFAEGTTRRGYQEYLCIANPGQKDLSVKATFLFENADEKEAAITVPGFSRRTLDVNACIGAEHDVSTRLASEGVFCAERVVYFNAWGISDGHCSQGAGFGSRRWAFAEGTTRPGFRPYICIENFQSETVAGELRFLANGKQVPADILVGPRSRATIDPTQYLGPGVDFSCVLETERPTAAEMVEYDTGDSRFAGGSCSPGDNEWERARFGDIKSYLNTYGEYGWSDLAMFTRFDVAVLDPYDFPDAEFSERLRRAGTIVLAYIDIGEVEKFRAYWPEVRDRHPELMLAPNPDWPGCYYADVNNPEWQRVIIEEAIPKLMKLGGFDGLCMDMLDTVDDYPGLKPGMIDLVKRIREYYPQFILMPNRGFGVMPEIMPYIDAFKYEEMSSRYDFDTGRYLFEQDQAERVILDSALESKDIPVFVLDHVSTGPDDTRMARSDFTACGNTARSTGRRFIWYANSVRQDHPLWPWLDLH